MSFVSSVGIGFRQAGLRLPSRGANLSSIRQFESNKRLFSSLLQAGHRTTIRQRPTVNRNFSLWPTSKSPPPSPTTPTTAPPVDQGLKPEELNTLAGTTPSTPVDTTAAQAAPLEADAAAVVDPATVSLDSLSFTDAALQHLPPALQYGDLSAMGLTGYSPAGIIRWSFEVINVTTGLPWFWTIVVGSAIWRFVCVPLTIKATAAAAKMGPHREKITALQNKYRTATLGKNHFEANKASAELTKFYKEHDISPMAGLVGLFQIPITLGLFFGVKTLCEFPVEQLKFSGVEMFPDLTIADPTLILPIAMTVAVNLQLLIGRRDVAPTMRKIMTVFHVLTIPGFFLMKAFPVGLLISILTTGVLTTLQGILMRIPSLRRALHLPAYVPPTDDPNSAAGKLWDRFKGISDEGKQEDLKEKVLQARRAALRNRRAMLEQQSKR